MRMRRFGSARWLGVLGLAVMLGSSGCAAVLVGAGAAAGYAVSRDHVELVTERPYAEAWAVCLEETKRMGLLEEVDEKAGRLTAHARGTSLVVTVERLTETTAKILIKARKHLLPQVETAQQLAARIARRLG